MCPPPTSTCLRRFFIVETQQAVLLIEASIFAIPGGDTPLGEAVRVDRSEKARRDEVVFFVSGGIDVLGPGHRKGVRKRILIIIDREGFYLQWKFLVEVIEDLPFFEMNGAKNGFGRLDLRKKGFEIVGITHGRIGLGIEDFFA